LATTALVATGLATTGFAGSLFATGAAACVGLTFDIKNSCKWYK
jgi:hypothetical protein